MAVCNHFDLSILFGLESQGHYTASTNSVNGWLYRDDCLTTELHRGHDKRAAYILFYERM